MPLFLVLYNKDVVLEQIRDEEKCGGLPVRDCGSGSINIRSANIGLFAFVNVYFRFDGNGGASNFNSFLTGNTLGISWNHIDSSYHSEGNCIHFTVTEVLNYTIFHEGIGIVYSKRVVITGSYDPCKDKIEGFGLNGQP